MVAAAVCAGAHTVRVALAVVADRILFAHHPVAGELWHAAQQVDEGGQQIQIVVEAPGHRVFCAARPFDNHGDMGGDIIGLTVLAIAAQLTQVLAVVGTDDDDRILVDALLSNNAVAAKEIIANYKPQYPSIKHTLMPSTH